MLHTLLHSVFKYDLLKYFGFPIAANNIPVVIAAVAITVKNPDFIFILFIFKILECCF